MTTELTKKIWMTRLLALFVVIVASVVFVATNGSMILAALVGLQGASLLPVVLGVMLSLAAIANRGLLNLASHRAVGLDAGARSMMRTATVSFAANKVVKSGGMSGLAVFLRHGRNRGHACSCVAASCLIAATASFAALGVLLATNLVLLALAGTLSGWWLAAGAAFTGYTLGLVALAWSALRSRSTARSLWTRATSVSTRLRRRRPSPTPDHRVDEFYDALVLARAGLSWRRVLVHAVISKALGAAMLLAATFAVGYPVTVTEAVLIYSAALAASLVSIVPGGIGFVEASIGALFITTGFPMAVAALAVGLFRVFDLWIPVAVGAVIGRHDLKAPSTEPAGTAATTPPELAAA